VSHSNDHLTAIRRRERAPSTTSLADICSAANQHPYSIIVGLIPTEHAAQVVEASVIWNYTTWLNIAFLVLAAYLIWRFLKTGGPAMLRMMNRPAGAGHAH
jgi:hypothetical protein